MKLVKVIRNVLVVLVAALFFGATCALAQEYQQYIKPVELSEEEAAKQPELDLETDDGVEAEVVATTGIFDAEIVSQDNNKFSLKFDLVNYQQVQPDVRHGVMLYKKGEGENPVRELVDQKVYEEITNLEEEDIAPKNIIYEAPAYLEGEYELWLVAKNRNGLDLGLNFVDNVQLTATETIPFRIMEETCSLVFDEGTRFPLNKGVDITAEETLNIVCRIKNKTEGSQAATAQFETYRRTLFGDKVVTDTVDNPSVTLAPAEEREVSFVIPKPKDPQAYDSVLTLVNDGKKVSNRVVAHWVLGGASGTIQNVRLNRETYRAGEEAKISFFWTGAANLFEDSRTGNEAGLEDGINYTAEITSRGIVCGQIANQELKDGMVENMIPVQKDCDQPVLKITLKDKTGKVLDEQTLTMYDETNSHKKISWEEDHAQLAQGSTKVSKGELVIRILVIVLILVLILILIFMYNQQQKKKKEGEGKGGGARRVGHTLGLFLLMALLAGFSYLIIGSEGVAAQGEHRPAATTLTARISPRDYATSHIALNRRTYQAGQTIQVSANGQVSSCLNAAFGHVYARYQGRRRIVAHGQIANRVGGHGSVINHFSGYTRFTAENCDEQSDCPSTTGAVQVWVHFGHCTGTKPGGTGNMSDTNGNGYYDEGDYCDAARIATINSRRRDLEFNLECQQGFCYPQCSSNYNRGSFSSLTPSNDLCSDGGTVVDFKTVTNSYGTVVGWTWACQSYGMTTPFPTERPTIPAGTELEELLRLTGTPYPACYAVAPCPTNLQCGAWENNDCPTTSEDGCQNILELKTNRGRNCEDLNRCVDPYREDDSNMVTCGNCGKCGTPQLNVNCGISTNALCSPESGNANSCCTDGWTYRPNNELASLAPAVNNAEIYMIGETGIKKIGNGPNNPYTGYQWQCGNKPFNATTGQVDIGAESVPPKNPQICSVTMQILGMPQNFSGSDIRVTDIQGGQVDAGDDLLVTVSKISTESPVKAAIQWNLDANAFNQPLFNTGYNLRKSTEYTPMGGSTTPNDPVSDKLSSWINQNITGASQISGQSTSVITAPGNHKYIIQPYCDNSQKDGRLSEELNIKVQCDRDPGPWSACSAQCGGGTRTRTETDPDTCQRIQVTDNNCNPQPCPGGTREY